MKSHFKFLPAALTVALFAGVPAAHSASDVMVTGKITPLHSACDITTSSQLDYGEIPSSTIDWNGITFLQTKKLSLKIDCATPAKMAFRFVDAQSGTAVNDASFLNEVKNKIFPENPVVVENAFGLGVGSDRSKTGALFMKEKTVMYKTPGLGNIQPTYLIDQVGTDWRHNSWNPIKHQGVYAADAVGRVPGNPEHFAPLTNEIWLSFDVTPALNTKNLSMKNPVNLDGKFACELIYL